MTDPARSNGLEELLPGEDPVLADEHPVRLGKGSNRFGVVGHHGLVPVGDQRGEDVKGRAAVALGHARSVRARLAEPALSPATRSRDTSAYVVARGMVARLTNIEASEGWTATNAA